jgi:FkbM family methyltransferase
MRSPTLAVRRVGQTLRAFDNGFQLLGDLAGPGEVVEFRLRGGHGTIACPNDSSARVPVYEVFVEDAYRIGELVAGLPDDLVAVEFGAYIGCFSVALALARPHARVHAWEASPSATHWLRRNLELNAIGDRVVPHTQAIGDHRGTVDFSADAHGVAMNGCPADTTTVEVPCVTVADAFAAAGGRVDLVKIDTEGAEYSLVLDSAPSTWSGVRRVVLEYHDVPGHSFAELTRFFASAGLRVHDVVEATPRQGTAWLEH